ncbi:MAG: glycosyltransferase family 4 protein [Acidimicrobiales bacterium]
MRVTAVHQFLPSLAPRDAIGTHTLAVQSILRALGLESEIYADLIHPEVATLARPFRTFRGPRRGRGRGELLLYQSSIGSRVADYLCVQPQPKLVNYHNITPAASLTRWEPALADELAQGRRQLVALAPVTLHAVADSTFNESELGASGYASTSVAPIQLDLDQPDPPTDGRCLARLARARARAGGGTDLLFVGRVVPNKAQHRLVRALALYRRLYDPRARLHLVGAVTSQAYLRSVRGLVERLGLVNAVDLAGPVSAAGLLAYYRSADVFVCLSDHEGFCLPLVEAMHHRLPIVAYAAAAVPETLGDAGVLIGSRDPLSVCVALARVLGDAELRASMSVGATRRLAELSPARIRAAFEASLRRAIALAETA